MNKNWSKDLSRISETLTAEELVDANTDFVKGVIYKTDDPHDKYVTPTRTFNGYCADCYVLERKNGTFSRKYDIAIPINKSELGAIVGVLISEV
jgi:hypothetical protein